MGSFETIDGASIAASFARLEAPPRDEKQLAWQPILRRIAAMPHEEPNFVQCIAERIFGAVNLLVTLPIMIVLAILIRLDSPGPILFRQWRVGRNGRLFRFTKFRTYFHDARERFPELYAYNYTPDQVETLQFKVPDDPRATRIGRWLRESTLDELPNFWNVVTGEMRLVGPRPEIPEMLPYYSQEELKIFTVPPGITGPAQVGGRGLLTFKATNKLNLDYIATRSLTQDFSLVAKTILKVITRHGAF
ncbi:MAG: sugar transferase [Bryobacterales bacterium]|nr:sugar transferase [Bryobacterales bacterium]